MKKVTVLAAAFALAGFLSIDANAQSQTTQPAEQQTEQSATEQSAAEQSTTGQATAATAQEKEKVKVTQDQLPEPVKEVLAQEAFQEWKVEEVYKVAGDAEGEKDTYEVICTNSAQEKGIVRIDEAGTVLKEEPKQ
ncbi:hypothetical protein [Pontibacter beigongshangensis]|uniref:hypothetical protein n=1 Tax=Pontibacter beigongshangensis TaxID=2574733 RepID=UPI00164FCFE5|nr:hypothetical protein [Pontibacter beigongshangensis]